METSTGKYTFAQNTQMLKYANVTSQLRGALLEENIPLRLLSLGPLGVFLRGPLWWGRALAPLQLRATCMCYSDCA